jgi:glycerol-3-phosphate dehydrogenase
MAEQSSEGYRPGAIRAASLKRLADERWDVLVIGGGIVGAGVLLDATSRGLKAALIERDDLAVGTSSRSSRLIHGGLRYLEQLRFGLVREALEERSRLMRLAPHLVRLERFLFPVYGAPVVHRAFYGSGLALYDLLGAARDGGRARHLDADATAALAPSIRRDGLRGGITYTDGVEDDARYAITVARTAEKMGASIATRVTAQRLLSNTDGQVIGVTAADGLADDEFDIHAEHVIDATGVWAGRSNTRLGEASLNLSPSRGAHLLFPRERIPIEMGMTLRIPKRVLFIVPWSDAWIVGTTDVADEGSADRPVPTLGEAETILENVNSVLDIDLRLADAVGAYAGLRPLVGDAGGETARASREHTVKREQNGLVRISGGKYTTYRIMAADAVDAALGPVGTRPASMTAELTLVGSASEATFEAVVTSLAEDPALDRTQAAALVSRHGTEASRVVFLGHELDLLRPLDGSTLHLEAEVAWAIRGEAALDLDDILSRRLRLATTRRDRCASILPRVAAIAAAELGWDAAERDRRMDTFLEGAKREYGVPGVDTDRMVASA